MLRARWSASREPELTIDVKRLSFVVALSFLANVSALLAADSEPAQDASVAVQATVDPSTGRVTAPTPEQRANLAAALAQMIDQRTEGLEVRRLPNGTRLVDLQGRFRNVDVAMRGTDGVVRYRCIDGADGLDGLLDRGSQPSPAPRPANEER